MSMITKEEAKRVLPFVRKAVAGLHEVWGHCRDVEKALGRDLDGLDGVLQDLAASSDDPELLDAAFVRDALNAQVEDHENPDV